MNGFVLVDAHAGRYWVYDRSRGDFFCRSEAPHRWPRSVPERIAQVDEWRMAGFEVKAIDE